MPLLPNGVVTWVPDTCPDGSAPSTSYVDTNYDDAQAFDVTDSAYYEKLIPNVAGGIVFGVLGLLGFIFFFAFLLVQCCKSRRRKVHDAASQEDSSKAQFLAQSSAPGAHSSYYIPPVPAGPGKRFTWGRFLKWLTLAVGLAAMAVCIWGTVLSIRETNSTVSDFWSLVDNIDQTLVSRSLADVQALDEGLSSMASGLSVWANQATNITSALAAAGIANNVTSAITSVANALPDALRAYQDTVSVANATIVDVINGTIQDIRDSFEPPTMAFQEKWRFVPIIVLFCTGAALCLVLGPLIYRMRWPKTVSSLTAVLWLNEALLMLLGLGLLNGVYVVSGDACLYSETFVLNKASQRIADSSSRNLVDNALRFYFGATNFSDTELVQQITGVDVPGILTTLQRLPLANVSQQLNASAQAAGSSLGARNLAAVLNLTSGFEQTIDAANGLVNLTFRSSVEPVYHQAKEYLCCSLNSTAQDLWVAWTVAGCMLFVFGALVTTRVISHTFSTRKRQRQQLSGAAGHNPPPPTAPDTCNPSNGGSTDDLPKLSQV